MDSDECNANNTIGWQDREWLRGGNAILIEWAEITDSGNSLAVRWLGLCAFTAEARVRSLVGELTSSKLTKKREKKRKEGMNSCFRDIKNICLMKNANGSYLCEGWFCLFIRTFCSFLIFYLTMYYFHCQRKIIHIIKNVTLTAKLCWPCE